MIMNGLCANVCTYITKSVCTKWPLRRNFKKKLELWRITNAPTNYRQLSSYRMDVQTGRRTEGQSNLYTSHLKRISSDYTIEQVLTV